MTSLIKVSLCDRRTARRYKNQEKPWAWLKDQNRSPRRTTETAAEYPKLSRSERDALKDQGGFVGGWLKEGLRKNGNVLCRSVGALDADHIPADVDFPALVKASLPGVEWFLYSTHRHTPEGPRFRLILLFDREVTEEEYPPLMRQVAHEIGMDYFDDTTYQANRMMYWASCPSDGEFVFEESVGSPLQVDAFLGRYEDWRDTAQWPKSSRQSEVTVRKEAAVQQNPLEKEGIVGTICRAFFPIQDAMGKYLSDIYAPTDKESRWDFISSESTAGVIVYDDRFVYSWHESDPACGKLLNIFDLIRIHRFGDCDSKESFKKMVAFALEQDEVKLLLDQERREATRRAFAEAALFDAQAEDGNAADAAPAEDRDWTKLLRYKQKSSELENSSWNLMLIMTHDPDLRHFAYNEMNRRVQVTGPIPWERPEGNHFWRDGDTAQLKVLLDNRYTVFSDRVLEACFTKVAEDRRFHPVRDYLKSLPPWDGECRVEMLFIRCLQAEDTPYTRAVARKVMAAAVARIMEPGVKFDSIPVLDGAQGIGKSSLFRELAGSEYYSETLSLTDMSDKSGAEKLQGFWIVEIGELAGMRKADIEKVKAFLSTADDAYRPSYGRVVESHPRQCVIVATVNGERGYLRDTTGNRRFWVVKCNQTDQVKRFSFTPEERDQIWAEALWLWNHGEKLYLEDDLREKAEQIQRSAMEEDDRQGMVEEYLNLLLPMDWPDMDLYARRMWLNNPDDPARLKGTVNREAVSNVEIWAECFGNDPMNMKAQDSYAIAAMMVKIEGWERKGLRQRIPIYGMQRLYVRDHTGMETPGPKETVLLGPLSSAEDSPRDSVMTVTSISDDFFDFLS